MATICRTALAVVATLLCVASGAAFVLAPVSLSSAVRNGGYGNGRGSCVATATHSSRGTYWSTSPSMALATPPPTNLPSMSSDIDTRPSSIKPISSHDEYLNALAENQDKLVVIKFYDQFCRACDEIRPRYEELSRGAHAQEAAFFQVEFTSCKDVCKQLGIRRLPTVQIYNEEGRVADLPAGPSRFSQVEKIFEEVMAKRA